MFKIIKWKNTKKNLAKKIMLNEWLNGTKLYILDPESEYKTMCKAIGGNWIDCSGGTGKNVGRINPLQVNKLPTNIEDEDEEEEIWHKLIVWYNPKKKYKFLGGKHG